MRDEELPSAAVRDLLGIVRALYGWAHALDPTDPRLPTLSTAGQKLTLALDLSRATVGSMGHSAAWAHAEQAVAMLGGVLCDSVALGDVFTTAKRRALTSPSTVSEREQRRRGRLKRG